MVIVCDEAGLSNNAIRGLKGRSLNENGLLELSDNSQFPVGCLMVPDR